MKDKRVNLHMDQRRTLVITVFFSLAALFFNLLAVILLTPTYAQLSSLLNSKYEYSVTLNKSEENDSYYHFNAGIDFSLSEDLKSSVNAEVLMQTENFNYTEGVNWNASKLGNNEVAISKGLARSNHLQLGDKIYSKNVVDGTLHEYVIKEIIPGILNVRFAEHRTYSDGVIVMGYEELYPENISYDYIVYTNLPISELASKTNDAPQNILYRSDEMGVAVKELTPYLVLFVFAGVIATTLSIILLSKGITHNYKRLVSLGYSRKAMQTSYNRTVCLKILTALCIGCVGSFAILYLLQYLQTSLLIVGIITLFEFVTLFITASLIKKKLWRG